MNNAPVKLADGTAVLTVVAFAFGAVLFLALPLLIGRFVRPANPGVEKNTPYESGEAPIGHPHGRFNLRFLQIALVFLLFDVEVVLLFPWATVFGQQELNVASNKAWGFIGLVEAFFFVGILALGLAYAWAKGHLDWQKPQPTKPEIAKPLPDDIYKAYKG